MVHGKEIYICMTNISKTKALIQDLKNIIILLYSILLCDSACDSLIIYSFQIYTMSFLISPQMHMLAAIYYIIGQK